MSYGGSARNGFNSWQLNKIVNAGNVNNNQLNEGRNYSTSSETTKNRFWHTCTNVAPYLFNIKKGDKIPRPLKNN